MGIRRIDKGQCGCNNWIDVVKDLWQKMQGVVRSIVADGMTFNPDGNGRVTMPGILSDIRLTSMPEYWIMSIDKSISDVILIDEGTYYTLEV